MRWSWSGYVVLTTLAALWTAGLFAASAAHAGGYDEAAILTRLFYAPVCHQDIARSFSLWNWPLSVCHRCSGIYLSFTLTLFAFPMLRRWRLFDSFSLPRLAIFILPLLLDYVLDVLGVWQNSPSSRAISGLVAGAGLALFTLPAWMEFWTAWRDRSILQSGEVCE
ncbi:MAG: DUF2085 domain-containing protein [Bacteroidetes bacterium]|nr:DUF2085 domain-containing protein [Bacteroidota bacterium]